MSKRKWTVRLLAFGLSVVLLFTNSSVAMAAEQIGLSEITEEDQTPVPEIVDEVTGEPTIEPTVEPSDEIEEVPLEDSTESASMMPVEEPSMEPSAVPTEEPSVKPSTAPTEEPSMEPSEEPSEELDEEPSEEPSGEDVSITTEEETLETEELSEEENEEESEAEVEEAEDDIRESDEAPAAEEESIYGKLPALSEKQLEEKENLRSHLSEIQSKSEGVDYVANQVIISAESEELALKYAKAFDGTVKRYIASYALIELNQSALDVILLSAKEDNLLPAAWPNYYGSVGSLSNEEDGMQEEVPAEDTVTVETDADVEIQNLGNISGYSTMRSESHHELVDTEIVWEEGYDGTGAKVAILSTGIDTYYKDTDPQTVDIGYGTSDTQNEGRGTLYASVIAGSLNDTSLLHGIAPKAELVSVRIVDDRGFSTDMDVIEAIDACYGYNVNIICLDYVSSGYNQALETAVNATRTKGVVLFCTAGDSATNATTYPAAYKYAYGVGALNMNKTRMGSSNYGASVSFAASGGYDDRWTWADGTGFATAVVSAQAAILVSSGKVTGTGEEFAANLITLMNNNCTAAKSSGMGKGIVSLPKALNIVTTTATPKKPQFSLKAGTYKEKQLQITMTSMDGSYIIYTTNGKDVPKKQITDPDKRKNSITISISGSRKTTIKARAVNPHSNTYSEQVTATYVLKPQVDIVYLQSPATNIIRPDNPKKKSTMQFTAEVYPTYAVNRGVTYYVEGNPKGITIDEKGLLTVTNKAAYGDYYVCCKTKNGIIKKKELRVLTEDHRVLSKIVPESTEVTLWANQSIEIPIKLYDPEGALIENGDYHITHNSSDFWIADTNYDYERDTLIIMSDRPGTAKVTLRAQDGSGIKKNINVKVRMPVTSISLNGSKRLIPGKSTTIKKILNQGDYAPYNKNVKWTISPAGQGVTIDKNGKVTATKKAVEGEYTVTCTAKDGQGEYETHKIEVTKNKVTNIKVEKSKVTLLRPNSISVKTEVTGGDIYSYSVSTNRTDLIKVTKKEGYILIAGGSNCKPGKATITIKSTDGTNIKKTIQVTVANAPTNLQISLPAGRTTEVVKGKTLQLSAVFGDDYGKVGTKTKKVKWTSSDPTVFKVNSKTGKVTCMANSGTAEITCKTTDGSDKVDVITLTAYRDLKSIYLSDITYTLNKKPNTITLQKGTEYGFRVCQVEKDNTLCHGRHPMKYTVDKQGLSIKSTADGYDIYVVGNKKGTYKLTISSADGSKVTKTYTIKVK